MEDEASVRSPGRIGTSIDGSNAAATGNASTARRPTAQIACNVDAEALRSAMQTTLTSARITVVLRITLTSKLTAVSFARLLNKRFEFVKFVIRELLRSDIQERCGGARARSIKEGLDQVRQRGPTRLVCLLDREEHVLRAFLPVADMPFSFQRRQKRPHGGVPGWVFHLLHDLRSRGPLPPEEDVHDLPFAAAQCSRLMWHERKPNTG